MTIVECDSKHTGYWESKKWYALVGHQGCKVFDYVRVVRWINWGG